MLEAKKILVLLAAIIFCAQLIAGEWQLKEDDGAIQVFTKHEKGAELPSYRGITKVNASLEAVVYLMRDLAAMENWFHLSYGIKNIKDIDEATRLIYIKQKTPAMLGDRDMILRQRMTRVSDSLVTVEMISEPGFLPKVDGLVRIPLFNAVWTLRGIDSKTTHVEYTGFGEPGGSIPTWLVNKLVTEAPYQTLKKLRKQNFESYTGTLDFLNTSVD
jgi:hypothetical protein